MQGCIALTEGQEAPSVNPIQKLRRAGYKRHSGVVSFGYFSLDKHKFVRNEFEQPIGWPAGRKYLGCRADKSAGLPICMRSNRRAKHMDVFRETDSKNRRDSDTLKRKTV